jgi:hypothetical protein
VRKVKRYSVWADELFGEKLAINSKNGMAHLVVKFDDYAAKNPAIAIMPPMVNAKSRILLLQQFFQTLKARCEFG